MGGANSQHYQTIHDMILHEVIIRIKAILSKSVKKNVQY